MRPPISVIIDTYNHERFIEEAIESVLAQDFPRSQMEILVVDDGSSDRTPEIVRRFEPQVRLLRKPNGGQASAINHGVAHAQGEFVAFLDGDDVWLPNKLSRVVAEFQSHPEAILVHHNFRYWDSRDGQEWEPVWVPISGQILNDRRKLLAYSAAPTSSLVFRRTTLNRIMPVPEQCSFNHDRYLITAAIFLGSVAAIPECLTKYRVHGENLYFAGRGVPDLKTLQRRIEVRGASIEACKQWMLRNVPRSARSHARYLVRRWQVTQDADEAMVNPPDRFRTFQNKVRLTLIYSITMTRPHLAYLWTQAFFELIVGPKHSHYIEGVRTRLKKLLVRSHEPPVAAGTGETGESTS